MLGRQYFRYTDRDLAEQAVWWLGPQAQATEGAPEESVSLCFPQSGLVSLRSDDICVLFDAGPFGPWSGGHSHSDTLGLVVTAGDDEILIDPGTYTYVGDPRWRDYFRGSAAHNTIRVDGREQAESAGPFRWLNKPAVELISWKSTAEFDLAEGSCNYAGIRHRRSVRFDKPQRLLTVTDVIDGREGECLIEQFWHPGEDLRETARWQWAIGHRAELTVDPRAECELSEGWRSDAPASKRPAQVLRAWVRDTLPVQLTTSLRIR